jgi:hypothetical protein
MLLSALVVLAALAPSLGGILVRPLSAAEEPCDMVGIRRPYRLIQVTTTADVEAEGSLRWAITEANSEQTVRTTCIEVPPGTYALTLGALRLSGGTAYTTAIVGQNQATTVIDGGGRSRVLDNEGRGLTLVGVTIQRGSGSDGGGIRNNGPLTIQRCRLADNIASGSGGALYHVSGEVDIYQSIFEDNSADTGDGGGIYHKAGVMRISFTTISRNVAGSNGGGLWAAPGGALGQVEQSALYSNIAGDRGGGIYHESGNLVLNAMTLGVNMAGANGAGGEGGGLYVNTGNVTVNNVTLDGNFVSTRSPQGQGFGISNNAGAVILHNSILLNNRSLDCAGTVTTAGGNIGYGSTQTPHPCHLSLELDLFTESRRFVLGNPFVNTQLPPGHERSPVQPSSPGIDEADPSLEDPNTNYHWSCGAQANDQIFGGSAYIDGNGDGRANCDSGAIEFYPLVDDMVTLLSTETSSDSTQVPHGPYGTYTEVRTYQKRGATVINKPFFEVTRLEGGNVLLNPDFIPYGGEWDILGGRGAIVEIGANTLDQPDQIFSVKFVIALQTPDRPQLDVSLRGERTQGPDQITIKAAVVSSSPNVVLVVATSSAAPAAQLFMTVPGCIDTTPMGWVGGLFGFGGDTYVGSAMSTCGSLAGREVTVTSSFGGSATTVIQQRSF